MAFFSQDLFEVFDEKSEPVSLPGRKRKRPDTSGGKDPGDEEKRFRSEGLDGSSSDHPTTSATGDESNVIDLTAIDESETKEDTMIYEGAVPVVKKHIPIFSERAKIYPVDNVEGIICTHEVAVPPNLAYEPLKALSSTPVKEFPFVLDPFQREALRCIENSQSVLVSAHTSAGKTVVAEYAIATSLRDTQRVIYTTPIKALSNQKYREMQEQFKDVGLMTGDVTINPSASCIVMTTEILRSMLYRGSEVMREVGWVIFDEIHYMRDPERGVVWEETIILLPDNVHYVFLSATIPNATQFAEWICHLHKQPCHVVYTDFRPTPLQHYIFPAGADGLYLVVDEKGNFKEDNFQQAMAKLQGGGASSGGRGRKGGQKGSSCFLVVKMIMERQLQPVIVFSFSRRDCEAYALQMSKLDFNTPDEKKLVEQVFTNAIDCLSEEDKKLPQVEHVLPLLKRGIGIHHSGLLPILKETTEILFQEGLIKALFATETFALGLNMPARTVVFTSCRKFDGKDFRWITSGEYIQMSGRAGRRGLDDRGIVMLMVDEQMDSSVGKNLLKGQPDPLNSAFHLTYNMVLNLLRVEEINPEYMLERSFYQFQNNSSIPGKQQMVKDLEAKRDAVVIEGEDSITNYYKLRQQIQKLEKEMQSYIFKPMFCVPFLQPGRLVKVEHEQEDFGWGCVVNYQKKANQKMLSETIYVAEVLLCCSSESCRNSPKAPPRPPPPGDKGEMQIVPIMLHYLTKLSSVRLYIPKDLRSSDSRFSVRKSIEAVHKKFPDGLPLLDPIKDMKIKHEEFKRMVRKMEALESRLLASPVHKSPNLEQLYGLCEKKSQLSAELNLARKDLKKAQTIMQLDELKSRKRVLRRLGYADAADVIEMKGRVACEISSGDELLLTELIFNGAFNDLSVEQEVALLSCFVFQEKGESIPKLTEELSGPLKMMQDSARRIARVSMEAKMDMDEENYVESFRPHLMDVVHAWSSLAEAADQRQETTLDCLPESPVYKRSNMGYCMISGDYTLQGSAAGYCGSGASFSTICKMTDVFEGSIIRCMRRLEELLRQMCQAAKAIGNTDLENKFAAGIMKIKRDIVFAASLYL